MVRGTESRTFRCGRLWECVPDDDRAVVAGRGDLAAIATERDRSNPAGMPLEREQVLAAGPVPEPDGLVMARGDEPEAVGTERHAVDPSRMPFERALVLPVAASQSITVLSLELDAIV